MPPTTCVRLAFLGVLALSGLLLALYFIPFEAGSYLFYAGVIVALCGVAASLRPMKWLLLPSRRAGLTALSLGCLVAMCGFFWPFSSMRAAGGERLDAFLPEFHFREVHSMRIHAPREKTFRAVQEATFGDLKVYRLLMSARLLASGRRPNLPPDNRPILATMTRPGSSFFLLESDPGRETVCGTLMNFGRPGGITFHPKQFTEFATPGWVKVAFNLRVEEDTADWSRVLTETRIRAVDEATARRFARYWRIVYPGSAILRRMWVRAIAARAESGG